LSDTDDRGAQGEVEEAEERRLQPAHTGKNVVQKGRDGLHLHLIGLLIGIWRFELGPPPRQPLPEDLEESEGEDEEIVIGGAPGSEAYAL